MLLYNGMWATTLPADMRGEVRALLDSGRITAGLADDLALTMTEMLTNAALAGAGLITVALALGARETLLEVTDDAAGRPSMRQAGPGDLGGRGLQIVEALSDRWGWRGQPGSSKTVWAAFTRA